ncbi:MAG: endo alpha-1,4 polygalactosaminidase [Anaerolineae bacterium]|nr:endo alpha-1,4 polygalactosaminidase [Anaerolineae bacterium]
MENALGRLDRRAMRAASVSFAALLFACAAVGCLTLPVDLQAPPQSPNPQATPGVSVTPASPSASADVQWASVDSWVYQLTGYRNDRLDQIAATRFDLAVIDLARDGDSDFFTHSEIAALQATGKVVLAYFEIGAIEDYRPEWDEVPPDLMLGALSGWPGEQYVAYWDPRWWPIVEGRVDQALAAGFDGAYLDMIATYEEIPAYAAGTDRADLAQKMVDLIARISAYARAQDPAFKVVPQNSPELHTVVGYLGAIDGLGMEELYVLAMDEPCTQSWCLENRANAAAVHAAGKLVLTVDYATTTANIDSAYRQSLAAGFVPYVSVRALDIVRINEGWEP